MQAHKRQLGGVEAIAKVGWITSSSWSTENLNIVSTYLPLTAAARASPMPVLPDVGSTITDLPGFSTPFCSASSTIR